MAVLALFVLLYKLSGGANHTTIALSFLLVVLFAAAKWGLAESIVTSVAAALLFNFFFLPPIGTWTISEIENWVALGVFLITAIVASELSARARARAEEALEHERETERLYTLNRTILLTSGSPSEVASETAHNVAEIFDVPAVGLYEMSRDSFWKSGAKAELPLESMKECSRTGSQRNVDGGLVVPLNLGGKPIGSLAILGTVLPDGALHAITNLVSIALERAETQELANQTELIRRQEEFKSSLLDALAHEFKTPLTAITAAASAIAFEETALTAEQRELLRIVLEETERLDSMVTETIKMAQIEAGKARLNRSRFLLGSVIEETIARTAGVSEAREIRADIPVDLEITADRELVGLALKQFVDNALKYSPSSTPIVVSAAIQGDYVRVCVEDQGPGIDETEQQQIFEKYYRTASSSGQVKGAGVGLSVARDVAVAHGGRAWVESVVGQGSRFYFTLPLPREDGSR